MFSNGDAVLYGAEGVCRLEGSTQREIGGKKLEYYVLKPVYRAGSTVFVPKGNETLTAKMRRVLSPEEIHKLIQEIHSFWQFIMLFQQVQMLPSILSVR